MKTSKKIAVIALMSATMTGGKMAMAFLPNVEPVSILLAVYAFVFGFTFALPAAFVFALTETLIWGVNTWVISYFIYWPLLAVVFSLLSAKKAPARLAVASAVALTAFFGVLTSLVDVGLFMGRFDNFWARFGVMYARGVVFYAVHIVSNLAIFCACFRPLCRALAKIQSQLFPAELGGQIN